MTPDLKRKRLKAIGECLQHSPMAGSFPQDWRAKLFSKHLEHPERSPHVITWVEGQIGGKDGWIMIQQKGGGFTIFIWAINRSNAEVQVEVEDLAHCLQQTRVLIQVRWTRPHEFLRVHGYQIENGATPN